MKVCVFLLFIPFFFFSRNVDASYRLIDSKIVSNQKNENSYDTSGDGKIDYIEVLSNNMLVEKRIDNDNDGEIDLIVKYLKNAPSKLVELRKYYQPKSKFPHLTEEFIKDLKNKNIKVISEYDDNEDGVIDRKNNKIIDLYAVKENCDPNLKGFDELNSFADNSLKVLQGKEKSLVIESYNIDAGCFKEKGRDWFLMRLTNAMTTGMSCLKDLADKNGRGAQKNYAGLDLLMKRNKIQLYCSQTDYDWHGTLAHATVSSDDEINGIKHPAISLNPNLAARLKSNGGDLEFEKTLFHEQLHNLGYRHGHDIEYPYACEVCCFPNDEKKEVTNKACQICSGNYSSGNDINYVSDISEYGALTYSRSVGKKTNISFLKNKIGDELGLAYLALNTSGYFDPAGVALAKKLDKRKGLDSKTKGILEEALSNDSPKEHVDFEKTSNSVADVYLNLFAEGDVVKAIENLESNLDVYKKDLSTVKVSDPDSYIRNSLLSEINSAINIIWLEDYTGTVKLSKSEQEQLQTRAYKLSVEIEKIKGEN